MTTIANILRGACKYRALGKEQQGKLSDKKQVGVREKVSLGMLCVANHNNNNTHLLALLAAVDITRMGSCNRCIYHGVERCATILLLAPVCCVWAIKLLLKGRGREEASFFIHHLDLAGRLCSLSKITVKYFSKLSCAMANGIIPVRAEKIRSKESISAFCNNAAALLLCSTALNA